MAIEYKGRAIKSGLGPSLTISEGDFNVTPVVNDLIVCLVISSAADGDGGSTPDLPAGFTSAYPSLTPAIGAFASQFGGADSRLGAKPWVAGDSYTATGNDYMTFIALSFSGVDSASPFHTSVAGVTNGTGTSQVLPSISPDAGYAMLVGFAFTGNTTAAYTSTGTMTNRATASATTHVTVIASEGPLGSAAGATGTRTFTAGAAGSNWAGGLIALRELVSVVPTITIKPKIGWGILL